MTANGTHTEPPPSLRRLESPAASGLAGLCATFEDLQTVLRCCELLVGVLAPPRGTRPPATPRPGGRRGGVDRGPALLRPLLRCGQERTAGRRHAHRGRRGRDAPRCRGARVAPGHPPAARPLRRPGGEPPGAVLGRRSTQDADGAARGWRSPRSGSPWSTSSRCASWAGSSTRSARWSTRGSRPGRRSSSPRSRTCRPQTWPSSRSSTLAAADGPRGVTGGAPAQDLSPATAVAFVRGPLPLLGPAFVAAIAYVDPGNFATNIPAAPIRLPAALGAVVSNLMAMLIQYLSAKVGIATGKSLASSAATHFPRPVATPVGPRPRSSPWRPTWRRSLGGALALRLLFGLPLLVGGLITAVVASPCSGCRARGFRPLES